MLFVFSPRVIRIHQLCTFRSPEMNICTPTSVLVGAHEIVEFHILRVGTGKTENSDIFKILKHSHFRVMCTHNNQLRQQGSHSLYTNNEHTYVTSLAHTPLCTRDCVTQKSARCRSGEGNVWSVNVWDDTMYNVERASGCTRKTGISHFACRYR